MSTQGIESVPQVCDVLRVPARAGATAKAPDVLIELPHGATRASDFDGLRRRLVSRLPDELSAFFFVNTDVGSYECAAELARRLTGPEGGRRAPNGVLILRSLIPRTFIDCNRIVEHEQSSPAEMTPALPEYITAPADRRLLVDLHSDYQCMAREAYERICTAEGMALQIHTYAPRSIGIDRIDGNIVNALRRAYEPVTYEKWKKRPDVDIISEASDGRFLAPRELVADLKAAYRRIGIEARENATYRLHHETMGFHFSERFEGRVLCMEISRALLADPFSPFEEMQIGRRNVERMTAPIVEALVGPTR